ncbi:MULTISPECIES: hypothetical protein [Streptococcus]|uniref:hypothetical protein n=1 Tax=Streptococcus TaxID=1301 RepID=UPI0012D8227C|nr:MULTISPECIES: hypothetical protein [Streptococcus]
MDQLFSVESSSLTSCQTSLFNSQKIFKKALAKIKKCDILNSWIVTGHAGKT